MDLVNDLFHVIIAGIVLGAGLPLIYALAIRFSVPKQGQRATPASTSPAGSAASPACSTS